MNRNQERQWRVEERVEQGPERPRSPGVGGAGRDRRQAEADERSLVLAELERLLRHNPFLADGR